MRYNIDAGRTFLPLCECGWRGYPVMTRADALDQLADHERAIHADDRDARVAQWRHAHPGHK